MGCRARIRSFKDAVANSALHFAPQVACTIILQLSTSMEASELGPVLILMRDFYRTQGAMRAMIPSGSDSSAPPVGLEGRGFTKT